MLATARKKSDRRTTCAEFILKHSEALCRQDAEVMRIDETLNRKDAHLDALDAEEAKLLRRLGEIQAERARVRKDVKAGMARRRELEQTIDQPLHGQMADLAENMEGQA